MSVDPTEAFEFVRKLSDDAVLRLLVADPLGADYVAGRTYVVGLAPDVGRWFLYDLFLARPAWFREAVENHAAEARDIARQLSLL